MSNDSEASPLPLIGTYLLFPCSGLESRGGWFEFCFEFRAEPGVAVLGNV